MHFTLLNKIIKFGVPWQGPYLVVKKIGEVTYSIQKSIHSKPRTVHIDHLCPYTGNPPKSWAINNNEKLYVSIQCNLHV